MKNEELGMRNEELGMRNEGKRGKLWQSVTVLIFTFSLFIFHLSCTNPFEQPKAENPDAGKGYFSLAVDGVRTGRTILPATVQGDFEAYTLKFFAEGTTDETDEPVVTEERTNSDLSDPVTLEVGTYDLYVTAYMDEDREKPAAYGSLTGIEIGPGEAVTDSVTLTAVIDDGEGTFSWDISYPANVTEASMTITPLGEETEILEQTLSFTGATPDVETEDSVTLNAGYYRVVFNLRNNVGKTAAHREILHIYKNMDSAFSFTFEESHFTNFILVTNGANAGAGSLRQAISDVDDGGTIRVDHSVGTIALTSELSISKSLTIEGNGVIITTNSNTRLLATTGVTTAVNISRVWFKDGRMTNDNGGAISNNSNLSLESCIFSGNQVSNFGGAVYSNIGTMSVKGCTFYGNNSTDQRGGAIYMSDGTLTLEGNLFYGNTGANGYPAVGKQNGTVTSLGYNVVDVALGTGNTQSGFAASTDPAKLDKENVSVIPISPVSFKLLSGSGAAEVITSLPVDYPAIDFYGNPITALAAAGAVQSVTTNSGYYLVVSVNNDAAGSIDIIPPEPDADGLYSDTVTITATPTEGFGLLYWLKNGGNTGSTSTTDTPLSYTLSFEIMEHTTLQAVFGSQIAAYLSNQTGGDSADDFIVFNPTTVMGSSFALGTMTAADSGWRQLLDDIAAAGKYVSLDLSSCTMTETTFNPDPSVMTGKDRIVSITLPDDATSIQATEAAYNNPIFRYFTALTGFNGAKLTTINDYAFYGITSLTMDSLPETVTNIGNQAFQNCTNLALSSLPTGVTSIGNQAFYNCTRLVLTSLPEGVISIGNSAFRICTSLTQITLPSTLTTIGDDVFNSCTGLTQITLPSTLTSIGAQAFRGCTSLTQITLPSTLTSIGNSAFYGCTNLATVTCNATTPPTLANANAFTNTPTTQQIKVPADSVDTYKAANNWSTYASRIVAIE